MYKTKISYGKAISLIPFFVIAFGLITFFTMKVFKAEAQDTQTVATSVTVGNTAPSITTGPAESPASSATAPTAIGSSITFSATASDANGENYYLIICSTNSVTAGTSGGAPTCGGTTYCTSSSTTSGSATNCSYTTQASNAWSNAWYAFVCDANTTTAKCSSSYQGTGDSGSPFFVNHVPTFTAISNNSPVNPGATVTWSATASDADTSSTVKLLVCKTNAISAGTCTGGAWCTSSAVASNPTCSYSVPSPNVDGSNNAYVFVVDQFNIAATGAAQGSNSSFTVNNVAPVVSAVTLNGGTAIDLTENSTKAVTVTATVTDNNGCSSPEISSVVANVYRSGITNANCTVQNNNNCYYNIACSVVGGTCSGATDAAADYTCTINMQYYADPTDTNTLYPTESWLTTVKATDNNASTHSLEVTTGVEVNSLTAFDITPTTIDYGSLAVLGKNDPLDRILTTTATGNVGLDQSHYGSANMCTNYPACTGGTPIPVGNQKYALATSTSYASGTALTTTATEVELNVPKVTATATSKNTWWGILIPNATLPGVYTGQNTITAVKGETANW